MTLLLVLTYTHARRHALTQIHTDAKRIPTRAQMYEPRDRYLGSESWLDETMGNSEVFSSNFQVYRKDRNSHGCGVFILVKNDVQGTTLNLSNTKCESVWCIMSTGESSHLAVGLF